MHISRPNCAAIAWSVALGALPVLAAAGCGSATAPSNVGRVSGQVTLAGQPLPDAVVTFAPVKPGGSTALGKTDAGGNYTLNYANGIEGAEIGENRVSVSTFVPANPDSDPPRAAVPEKVPAKYNSKTELTKEVKAGNNKIDLPLEAGPVVQPAHEPE